MSTMKFGIDYDGVIADTNRVKSQWIKKNLGITVQPWKTDRTQCVPIIGLNNYERMSREVYGEKLSLEAPLVPGVRNALSQFNKKGKVFIVTSRTLDRVRYAQKWLEKHNLNKFINRLYSFAEEGSKETIARKYQLDVLVDDDVRHLQDSSNKKMLNVWFKNGWKEPTGIPPGIHFAKDWGDVLKIVTKYYGE